MQNYLPLITGGGGALVVLALMVYAFYAGKVHSDREFCKLEQENEALRDAFSKLQEAIDTERRIVNDTASAGKVTNQLIAALATIATGRKQPLPPADLTAEDLGL